MLRRFYVLLIRHGSESRISAPAHNSCTFSSSSSKFPHHLGPSDLPPQPPSSCSRLLFARGSKLASGFSLPAPKSLDAILKVETVRDASPQQLAAIWNEYHIGRGHISVVMETQAFNTLQHRAKSCPSFVIPLRQDNGYVSMFLQAQMPHMLFTGLEDYKARGAEASPYFTVSHYSEFAETKGVILVRGDIVFTSKLSDAEAKVLLETAHSFYINDSRFQLVQRFNKQSGEFEFRDVLWELGLPLGP